MWYFSITLFSFMSLLFILIVWSCNILYFCTVAYCTQQVAYCTKHPNWMVLSFFFFLATPHSLWDHNSPQGIEPVTLAISVSSPNNWTARKFPNCLTNTIILLLGPSLLCLLHNRPVNPRDEVLRQGRDFNRGAENQEDSRLVPQDNHLIGVWMPGVFL